MAGDRPALVPAGIVEALRAKADAAGVVPLASLALFERGAAVRIVAGAFAGQVGRYEDLTPDRVVTDAALRNAAIIAMATGCSTNAVVHLIAMARALNTNLGD